jgi:hypothetical protein
MLVLLLGGEADRPLDVIALCGYEPVQENVEQVVTIFHASSNQPGTRAVVSACSMFTRRKPHNPPTGKVHQAVQQPSTGGAWGEGAEWFIDVGQRLNVVEVIQPGPVQHSGAQIDPPNGAARGMPPDSLAKGKSRGTNRLREISLHRPSKPRKVEVTRAGTSGRTTSRMRRGRGQAATRKVLRCNS